MWNMENIKSNLQDLKNSLSTIDILFFMSVVVLLSIATFTIFDVASTQSENPEQIFEQELNNTHNSAILNFFNETMEISMEQGSETTFYVDLDAEGNADMQLENLTRDGKIRSSSNIFDYRSGVYILHFSYHIGENDEEHWLEPKKIEKIG